MATEVEAPELATLRRRMGMLVRAYGALLGQVGRVKPLDGKERMALAMLSTVIAMMRRLGAGPEQWAETVQAVPASKLIWFVSSLRKMLQDVDRADLADEAFQEQVAALLDEGMQE